MGASSLPEPDWTVAPGELLAEILDERGISQAELARRMGRPTKTINEIVNGKAAITPQTAIQLERVLATSASFWINAEAAYRYDLARFAEAEALEKRATWLERFPVKDLVRAKLIDDGSIARQVEQLLGFFGVGSPEAWEAGWGNVRVSYRQSSGDSSPEARAVWLRWGEVVAEKMNVAGYDPEAARRAVGEAAHLSVLTPAAAAVDELGELLANAGVCLVLLPEISGTRLNGAAHWPSADRPIVQLSGRHRRDDHFWFTVLHELGHIIDSPHQDFADVEHGDGHGLEPSSSSPDEEAEARADQIAREALVPSALLRAFLERSRPDDREAVRSFARDLDVAPGIVVGRLQRDGLLGWELLNDLKRKYELD
jgi:HTH-type transcriptional regulator/antitoxin HigA